jgi:hypothetical protein
MSSIAFSYFDTVSRDELISLLARAAKVAKRADPSGQQLAVHQNAVAQKLGYKNWSLLHKDVQGASWSNLADIRHRIRSQSELGPMLSTWTVRTIDEDDAVRAMKAWARSKYTPLVNFAFRDNESPTGYSWPSVEMEEELMDEFAGQYPDDLILKTGYELDGEEGPWGLEKYD